MKSIMLMICVLGLSFSANAKTAEEQAKSLQLVVDEIQELSQQALENSWGGDLAVTINPQSLENVIYKGSQPGFAFEGTVTTSKGAAPKDRIYGYAWLDEVTGMISVEITGSYTVCYNNAAEADKDATICP